jgi:hypothetical protein
LCFIQVLNYRTKELVKVQGIDEQQINMALVI